MPLIIPVRGFTPEIGPDTFLAENCTIVGDVKMGSECSVWFNTVLRGDVNSRRINRPQRDHTWGQNIQFCTHRHGCRGDGRRRSW